jgi:RNA polymerase sigma-70 factor, ECF subfamily
MAEPPRPAPPLPWSVAADAAHEAGRAQLPSVTVAREEFTAHATKLAVSTEGLLRYGADLFLACACTERVPEAIRIFETRVFPEVVRNLNRAGFLRSHSEDVLQMLRLWLLGERPPRIAAYAAKGPLLGWLKVVTVRRAMKFALRRASDRLRPDDGHANGMASAGPDPELLASQLLFRADFQAAFDASLAALTPHAREILTLHYLDGRTLEEIAGLHAVHKSTVSRWLTVIQTTVLTQVRNDLPLKGRTTTSEFRKIATDVQDILHVDWNRAARKSG